MSTEGIAKRGALRYNLPKDVEKGKMVKKTPLQYLLDVINKLTQERDAVKKVRDSALGEGIRVKQIGGFTTASQETDIQTSSSEIDYDLPVKADTINRIINIVNEVSPTVGGTEIQTVTTTCDYTTNVELIERKEAPVINCPLSQIDPQGQIDLNTDNVAMYDVCNNIGLDCGHRKKLLNWVRHGSASNKGFTWICTNTQREKQIEVSNGTGYQINTVSVGERILAQTFNDIMENVRMISYGLDEDEFVQGDNGGNMFNHYGYCKRVCQLACQTSCQLACQTCYGGTCYDVHFTF